MSPSLVFVPHPQDLSLYFVVRGYHQSVAHDVLPHGSVQFVDGQVFGPFQHFGLVSLLPIYDP